MKIVQIFIKIKTYQGIKGSKGMNGEPGRAIIMGMNGENGAKGSKGERGNEGEPGLPGLDGLNGYPGPPGNKGVPGELGPEGGVARINIIKAKDLVKSDLIGKSDPYAVIKYGTQKDKTPVVKNSQNPEWNHTTELKVPEDGANKISLEVFDQDRIGKDKSLGKLDLDLGDLQDLADADGDEGRWFPLKGVKSGQILLSGDLLGPGLESDTGSAPSNVVGNNRNESLSGPRSK